MQSSTFAPIKGSAFKAAASAFILAARRYPNIPIRPSSFMLVSWGSRIFLTGSRAGSGNLTNVFDKTVSIPVGEWFFFRLTPRVFHPDVAQKKRRAQRGQGWPKGHPAACTAWP